jgi:predicted ester cyclase
MDDRQAHARRALEDVCARGDLDAADELYARDFVDHVNRLEFRGQEGIAESVALYRAVFPDLAIRVEDQVTERDRVVSRWRLEGTHHGRRVILPGITISRFENGAIAEDWTVSDNAALLQQLGPRRAIVLAARWLTGRLG